MSRHWIVFVFIFAPLVLAPYPCFADKVPRENEATDVSTSKFYDLHLLDGEQRIFLANAAKIAMGSGVGIDWNDAQANYARAVVASNHENNLELQTNETSREEMTTTQARMLRPIVGNRNKKMKRNWQQRGRGRDEIDYDVFRKKSKKWKKAKVGKKDKKNKAKHYLRHYPSHEYYSPDYYSPDYYPPDHYQPGLYPPPPGHYPPGGDWTTSSSSSSYDGHPGGLPVRDPIGNYRYGGKCYGVGSEGLPCAPQNLGRICNRYNKQEGSFRDCLEACAPSFCCIHDAEDNRLAKPCQQDQNCAQYGWCYIVWWKLHDTIGPALYIDVEQNDEFYDVKMDELAGDYTGNDFWNQVLLHHFDDWNDIELYELVNNGEVTAENIFNNPAYWKDGKPPDDPRLRLYNPS